MTSGIWDDLHAELAAWAEVGRAATMWWRDDDATTVTPALERLLALSRATSAPIALAVIPRDADDRLRAFLGGCPLASVLQHGWAHEDHSRSGRAAEYGPERSAVERIAELGRGWEKIATFPRALPALVAPWNRMDEDLIPDLPKAGLAGVSTEGPRRRLEIAPGVRRVNIHIDVMDWETRRFKGEERAIGQTISHLRARRIATDGIDPEEPTGLMTHHAFHDDDAWRFVADLIEATMQAPSVRWIDASEAFQFVHGGRG